MPRKPKAFGVPDSHRDFRYSYRHHHFCFVQRSSRSAFNLEQNAPLPSPPKADSRGFGDRLEPRYIFGAASLDQSDVTRCLKDGCF